MSTFGKKETVESGKTYLGVIEDNKDPDKKCRCRVRVFDVHDGKNNDDSYNIPTDNLPWALPWKDLNGNVNNIPDLGKVVVVVFENGNPQNPEYIHSKHYNTNLEQKLSSLSDKDYLSMKSLIFDHKTQIYVNESEGLKIDHKFNNINITKGGIDLNLKDNFGHVNIGSAKAEQSAILGDNFTDWFDTFLNLMLTNRAFIGNFAAPIVPSPALMKHIQLYKAIKEPKILSKHVKIVDNNYVQKLDRIADATIGDNWKSTIEDNKITKKEKIDYESESGSSETTFTDDDLKNIADAPVGAIPEATKVVKVPHQDVKIIHRILRSKGYQLYTGVNQMNIVAVRNQCLSPREEYTDSFVDKLHVMYKDEQGEWNIIKYPISTVPGTEFTLTESLLKKYTSQLARDRASLMGMYDQYINQRITTKKFYQLLNGINGSDQAITILVPSQYIDSFEIGSNGGSAVLQARAGATFLLWRDKSFDRPEFTPEDMPKPLRLERKVMLTKGFPGGVNVGHWGLEGDQLFSNINDIDGFMRLCVKHQETYGNSFTYTVVTKQDMENAVVEQKANPDEPILEEEKKAAEKENVTTDKNLTAPEFLNTETKILAFQSWSNRKKETKLKEDSKWTEADKEAWDRNGDEFQVFVNPVEDDNIWFVMALIEWDNKTSTFLMEDEKTYAYQQTFKNNSYRIKILPGNNFTMFMIDKESGIETQISNGKYSDGCRTLNLESGKYQGMTFKDTSAVDNIIKITN